MFLFNDMRWVRVDCMNADHERGANTLETKAPSEFTLVYSVDHGGTRIALLRGSCSDIVRDFPEFEKVMDLFGARADRVATAYGVYERNRRKGCGQLISGEMFNRLAQLDGARQREENPVLYEIYERKI